MGEFQNHHAHGGGTLRSRAALIFDGHFEMGVKHGAGKIKGTGGSGVRGDLGYEGISGTRGSGVRGDPGFEGIR